MVNVIRLSREPDWEHSQASGDLVAMVEHSSSWSRHSDIYSVVWIGDIQLGWGSSPPPLRFGWNRTNGWGGLWTASCRQESLLPLSRNQTRTAVQLLL